MSIKINDTEFATIQDAIDAAVEGQTVVLSNGTYAESFTLKSGVSLTGESEAGVVVTGTMSTPADFADATVSNLTVTNASATAMLLDMRGTSSVTDIVFDHVTFSLGAEFTGPVAIGNGQVSGTIAVHDGDDAGDAGLTFQNVTMASNDLLSPGSTAFVYTTIESVDGAKMVLDHVNLTGATVGSNLGAQWNMTTPNNAASAAVEIVASSTGLGGNFYISGFDSVLVEDNTFDGQGLALNGVENAQVVGNTFQNIDDTYTANGTQHRGLVIEDAWGTDGASGITVTGNTFTNIDAVDGAIAFQRFTDSGTATIDRLNDIDIHGNTFTDLGAGVDPIYVNDAYFGGNAVLPADFEGSQLRIGSAGTDTVTYADSVTIQTTDDGLWTVTSGDGIESLSDVEIVDDGAAGNILLVGNGGYTTIQEAIGAASIGDTIYIGAGIYTGNVVVNVDGLTIIAEEGAVLQGTFRADNTGVNPATSIGALESVADYLFRTTAYSGASGAGITIQADGVTVQNLEVRGYNTGVELANGTDGASLTNMTITETVNGIRKGSGAAVTDLTVTGGEITDSSFGMYIAKESAAGRDLDGLTISGTSFSDLTQKGIYAETLSDALITGITMTEVGELGRGPAFGGTLANGNLGGFGGGIDINLKWDHEGENQAYSNIVIEDFTFTNVGSSNQGGAGEPHFGGAAIAIKARDDAPSYSSEGASFDGTVVVRDGSITGTSVGIRVGEPNKANPAANVTGPDVEVSGVSVEGALVADANNVSKSVLTVEMAAGDTIFVAQDGPTSTGAIEVTGTDGNDSITTASGDDTIDGGAGNDMLDGGTGADAMSGGAGDDTYMVDNAGDTTVEEGDEGTDTVITADSHTLAANVENLTLVDLGSNTQTFDDMALGAISNGENGWKDVGPADDQGIVDLDGNQVWRISSDPASGDFGGPYSPSLSVSAGEPQTTADGEFHAIKFRVKAVSETPDNSRLEVDFANTGGTDRNNFMVIESVAGGGLRIAVNEPTLEGEWSNNAFTAFTGNRELVSGVDASIWHDIELRLTYVDGADNDVVQVYLDGALIGTTTTFENYRDALGGSHEANAEANQTARVIFRGSNSGQPTDGPGGQNQGFYFDNLSSTVAHNASGTGNDLANVITGNSGDNVLSGLAGNDTILGGDGNDTIVGGTGEDSLSGGAGDDTFVEVVGEGVDTIDGGAGTDTLELVGTDGNDSFTAIVSGGQLTSPGETLTSIEDITLDLGGEAGDTLSYAGTTEGVTVDLGTGSATGFTSIAGVENVTGGSGADSLTGNAGDNVLAGGGGNDTLAGGGGIDTAVYDGTATIAESGGGWTVTADGQGTDTLSQIERVDDGAGGQILLVGNGGFTTIQAAIDASSDGDTILIADATYTEALSISGKAITLQAAGENVVVQAPPGANAITLTGDFEGGNVSILGIEVAGAAALPNQGIGVYVTEDADIGILTLDGVEVRDAGSYGLYVQGDNESGAAPTGAAVANLVVTNSSFSHNGYNGANGSAHIKLFNFGGNALIQDVTIEGSAPSTPVVDRPDYGIELTGTRNGALAGGAVAMGTVTLAGVTMTGWLHKNGLAIFNYADIDGLTVDGVDLSGVVTDWIAVLNIDGILGDVDASAFDITLPAGTIATELQGDKSVQAVTDQTITGTDAEDRLIGKGGDDQLFGGAGDDELYGHDKAGGGYVGDTGDDVLDGGTGADTMAGGLGDDTYVVDDEDDVVTEGAGAGIDTVRSSIDYTLGDNLENLTLIGAAIVGTGNSLNNTIIGNAHDNELNGDAGNDILEGGDGQDTLSGGIGNDTLKGDGGDDLLLGSTGDDILDGGSGIDSMRGGTDNDTYVVDEADDFILESANQGNDTVVSSIEWTLGANLENLTLTGTGNINGTGNGLANALTGNAGNNVLDGGTGADTMAGGLGDDTYVVDNAGDGVTEGADAGTDLVRASVSYALTANVENLILTGSHNINGTGNGLANALTGNSGNNMLDGGAGADAMTGGAGNDTYVVDDAGDGVTEGADAGTDLVQASVSYALSANVENLTLTGSGNIDATGNDLVNALTGNSGNNVLDGGAGADTMAGGLGDDTYVVDNAGDGVTEDADAGTDLVQSSVGYTLSATVENLTLTGTGNINGMGNEQANVLIGNSGNNALNGDAGADSMAGGAGNDTYFVDNAGDVVTEGADAGTDLVRASVSYTLSANVENLTLIGSKTINGTGNDLANALTGNSKANVLDGGAGADTMTGGAGNDTYVVDDADDVVTEGANAGTDQVQASVSYALSANVENLTLTGSGSIDATGNDLANALTGNTGNNVLDGGTGADTMLGGLGDDTYVVDNAGDLVAEAGNQGADTVMSSVTWTLGGNLENLTLTGSGNINATGNELANVLTGNSGNNVLDGRGGADTMAGGLGDDTYVVNSVDDVVTEGADAGTDLVQTSVSYALSANVENLTLIGSNSINGTGNALANGLTGNTKANILDGGAGADTMAGGAGNDTYVVDQEDDAVTEAANQGVDLVQSSAANFTLSSNVENLTLTGSGNINGTGNGLANVLTGNAGNNVLDGGTGADTMAGGLGDDTYVVDNAGDGVTEGADAGTDLVRASVSYALTANVENLILTGSHNINGTGNGLANALTGNSGNNVLDGGAGADAMTGGAGNDTYVVDDAGDVVTEGADAGTDLVQASISYALSANVENLTLTGSGNIDATGNDLANALTGNSGANVLDGGAGADTMAGGLGDDTYVVDNAGDVVAEAGNQGADTVLSSVAWTLGSTLENLTLTGSANINATGNEQANTLIGNSGNNVLDGRGGADTMAGGLGDDTYVVNAVDDVVTEGADAGTDLVRATVSYTLSANVEELKLLNSTDINATGNELANVLTGNAGANVLDGGANADTMAGGAGNDTYVVDNINDVVSEGANNGTDLVQSSASSYSLSANVENLTLTGSGNIDGAGNALANVLTGNSGNNVLTAGGGNDTIDGGGGVDTAVYAQSIDASMVATNGSGGWTVTAGGAEGTDTLSDIEIVDGAGVGAILLVGNGGYDTIQAAIDAASAGDTILVAAGEYTGNVLIDKAVTLRGANAGIDGNGTRGAESVILGKIDVTAAAAVTIDGFEVLNTGATTGGGPSNPALWFATGGSGAGHLVTHTVFYSSVAGGMSGVDDRAIGMGPIATGAVRIEDNLFTGVSTGKYNDASWGRGIWSDGGGVTLSITGNEFEYTRTAINYDGPDGGASPHLTIAGNTFSVAGTGMSFAAGGTVTGIVDNTFNDVDTDFNFRNVSNSVTLDLGATENLGTTGQPVVVLGGSAADVITGSAGTDVLQGNGGTDTLNGGGGDDNLSGGTGDDILDGGTGADTMAGGADNDTYVVDNAGDVVTEAASAGTDLVQSSVDYALGDNLENLTLTGAAIVGSGNALNNTIVGNAQDNELDGGGGDDTMAGGLGNDTYDVDSIGDVVTEGADAGSDLVRASVSYSLSANVENLTLTGLGNIDATGNELANALTGNAGNNQLDGGAGVDTMAGGLGDDTYVVDVTGDVVTEGDDAGTDLVRASASYTLSANVENLTLTGTADIDGTGNALANVLTGNDGANLLDGGFGADTMAGGLGNDTYVVDNAGDVVTEAAAGGTDTVESSISYALGLNVENLTLTGGAIYGTGNDDANVITGNALDNELDGGSGDDTLAGGDGSDTLTGGIGSDTLDGGAGADLLIGGSGNDTYFVDDAGDIVSESGGPGIDAVFASINYTLGSNVENLTLTGEGNLNGTGNGLANTITGNAGDNLINGKLGNDTLTGGGGNDSFVFDTAPNGTTNVDQVTDFGVGNDVFNLAHSVFAQISMGVLSESAFHVGASATDADQRIVYDQTSGQVMYDADGSGGGAAVQFAAVTAGTLLTHDDFFVL